MAQLAPGRSSSSLGRARTKRWIDHSILIGEAVQFADIAQPLVMVTLDPRTHREKPRRRTSSDRSCERGTRTLPRRCQTTMSRVALQSSRRLAGACMWKDRVARGRDAVARSAVERVRQVERAAEKPKGITAVRPESSRGQAERDVSGLQIAARGAIPEPNEQLRDGATWQRCLRSLRVDFVSQSQTPQLHRSVERSKILGRKPRIPQRDPAHSGRRSLALRRATRRSGRRHGPTQVFA